MNQPDPPLAAPDAPLDLADQVAVLLPCPFCGGQAKRSSVAPCAICTVCGIYGPTTPGNTTAEAFAAWNRRAPLIADPALRDLVADLREKVGAMTPGPWTYNLAFIDDTEGQVCTLNYLNLGQTNARGIVALRNAAPRLLSGFAALEAEVERLTTRQRSDEQQLCDIATLLGKDARAEGCNSIVDVVRQRIEALEAENAKQAQCIDALDKQRTAFATAIAEAVIKAGICNEGAMSANGPELLMFLNDLVASRDTALTDLAAARVEREQAVLEERERLISLFQEGVQHAREQYQASSNYEHRAYYDGRRVGYDNAIAAIRGASSTGGAK